MIHPPLLAWASGCLIASCLSPALELFLFCFFLEQFHSRPHLNNLSPAVRIETNKNLLKSPPFQNPQIWLKYGFAQFPPLGGAVCS